MSGKYFNAEIITGLIAGAIVPIAGIIFSGPSDPNADRTLNRYELFNEQRSCQAGTYYTEGYRNGVRYVGCWVRDYDRDGILVETDTGETFGVPVFIFKKENPDAN